MVNENKDLAKEYNAIMNGFSPEPLISGDWPMENGMYKQYSAFEDTSISMGCTSYSF